MQTKVNLSKYLGWTLPHCASKFTLTYKKVIQQPAIQKTDDLW